MSQAIFPNIGYIVIYQTLFIHVKIIVQRAHTLKEENLCQMIRCDILKNAANRYD